MLDYLIVGQGISGSVLALKLLEKNKRIMVVDENLEFSSSKIAAGVCNPIVFKRLTFSWKALESFDFVYDFYSNFALELIKKVMIEKLISTAQEAKIWKAKLNNPNFLEWIDYEKTISSSVINHYGIGRVKKAALLDTSKFVSLVKEKLEGNEAYFLERFDFSKLVVKETISYKNIQAKSIIFSEGYKAVDNPFFSWIPFKLTKGEVIDVSLPYDFSEIIKKEVYIVPKENNSYRIGATYNWENINELITKEGLSYLLSKTNDIVRDIPTILSQYAGVRPTVIDRRPVLGVHPSYNNVFIFNGMGTKAVMLAPFLADSFVNFLLTKKQLDEEISINRFYQEYYKD